MSADDLSGFDPMQALRVADEQARRVRASLDVRLHEQFAVWGLAWLVGLGLMWLEIRTQSPYAGPTARSGVPFGVLLLIAGAFTGLRIRQATVGLGGADEDWRGAMTGLGWGLGFLGYFGLSGALARAGAEPAILGIVGVVVPLLVVGLNYIFGAAVWGARPMGALGAWMLVLAAAAGFTGPVTATLLGAVLGGGAFLVAAAWLWLGRRRRGESWT